MEDKKGNLAVYEWQGQRVKLSPAIVRKYLVSGNPEQVTDQEIGMFIALCQYQRLNPFLKEAYLIKYHASAPASMVVAKETYFKRAQSSPDYDGYEVSMKEVDGKVVSATCKVYRKSMGRPAGDVEVFMSEYNTGLSSWKNRPKTMLRKVAIVQSLREAFSTELGGMYTEDEIPDGNGKGTVSTTIDATALLNATVVEENKPSREPGQD